MGVCVCFFYVSCKRINPFAQLFQHCCSHARALPMVYKVLWTHDDLHTKDC